jgi:hypothetical protein
MMCIRASLLLSRVVRSSVVLQHDGSIVPSLYDFAAGISEFEAKLCVAYVVDA